MKLRNPPWHVKLLSLVVCFGAIGALSMTSQVGSRGVGERDEDIMAMLEARSPGTRPDGALIASKAIAQAGTMPRQYAMPKTRERATPGGLASPGPVAGSAAPFVPRGISALPLSRISNVTAPGAYNPFPGSGSDPGGIIIPVESSAAVPPVVGGPPVDSNPPGIGVPPDVGVPPGVVVPPDGGGGGGTPPPPVAVPEPVTWMSLIIGFGLTGAMIRLRRRRQGSGLVPL